MQNNNYNQGAPPPLQGSAPSAPPAAAGAAPPPTGSGVGAPPAMGEKEAPQEEKIGTNIPLEDLHIDELLHIVVDRNASDLHVCQACPPVIREDGKLKRLNFDSFSPQHTQRMMYDIISDENINKFETTLELDFSYNLPKRARFRVNMYRDKGAVAAAFRLIPQKIPTVEQLR